MPNHNQILVHPTNAFAELSLTKVAPAGPVEAGTNITYTLTVSNAGPYAATAVSVLDLLPFGVLFGSANASQGSCTVEANTVLCRLGTGGPPDRPVPLPSAVRGGVSACETNSLVWTTPRVPLLLTTDVEVGSPIAGADRRIQVKGGGGVWLGG